SRPHTRVPLFPYTTLFRSRLDYTVGTFWFEQDGTLEANVNLFYVQFNFIHGPDPTPSHNHAAFGHLTYRLTDRMNLSAGLRFSRSEEQRLNSSHVKISYAV